MKKLILLITLILIVFGFVIPSIILSFNEPLDETPLIDELEEIDINDASKSVLKVIHTMTNGSQIVNKSGSAVIVGSDDDNYYAVTNYHLLDKENYETVSISLSDYQENNFEAVSIIDNQALEIISETYDLALLKFTKNEILLPCQPLDINRELTPINYLYAIGYPNGIRTVTTGTFGDWTELSQYPYEVIIHTAPIDHGNSGGGLFDSYGYLVGINVAAAFDQEGNFIQAYAIPLNKVLEYYNLFQLRDSRSDV